MNTPKWRWRESNPRPLGSQRAFSERSRRLDLGSGAAAGRLTVPQPTEMSPAARRRDRMGEPCWMTPVSDPQG